MKWRNPRSLVLVCAVLALLIVPSVATAAGPGLGFALHQEDEGWSLTSWIGQLGSSFWSVLTYDVSKTGGLEIEKVGTDLDPNGVRRFERTSVDSGHDPQTADGG